MIGVVIDHVPEARPKEPADMWRDGPICSCAIAMFVRSTSATAKPSERRGCDKQKGNAVDVPICHSPPFEYIARVWVVCGERGGGEEGEGDGSECAEWERRLGGL